MAFTGNFMCTSFKQELLVGTHNFTTSTGDVFKLALYTDTAAFTAATTAYTATNEVANSGSYSAGGGALTNVTPTTSGTTALTDFDDLAFTTATITARGALIYNSSAAGNPTVCSTWILVRIKHPHQAHLLFSSQPQMLQTPLFVSRNV
jgi:hypothetical protein